MTIVYDGACAFCIRCARWIAEQRPALPLRLVPSQDPAAAAALGHLPGYGRDLLVVADTGQVWAGPDAFIVAMWCLAAYRGAAVGLAGPTGQRAARAFFAAVSARRTTLGEWLDGHDTPVGDGPCHDGTCAGPGDGSCGGGPGRPAMLGP
jgi:predicted DCC family thiol-disulfide oxidoreductase YuxK